MNRYKVTISEGTMYLYYSNIEIAKSHWEDALNIELYNDNTFIKYINKIKDCSVYLGQDYKGRYNYSNSNSLFKITIRFSKIDNKYIDYCEYLIQPLSSAITHYLWTPCTPKEVYEKFFIDNIKYEELSCCCKSKGEKINKPKELKGIKQIGSVKFSKANCGIFIKGNDLYINHHDYFSPSIPRELEDIGKPLGWLVQKYMGKSRANKFIYDDAWGDIVLQNVAWLKFENILPYISNTQYHIHIWMRDEVFKHLGFDNKEGQYLEWERFLEEVCDLVRKELK